MSKPPKFTKNVRYNPATGTEQYDGELVTAPREWQSAPDHPPTKLAYITEPEAKVLSELDLHGSGVSKEKHFGPKGIPSYNGIDGGLGDGATSSGVDTGAGGSAVGAGGAYSDVNANPGGAVGYGVDTVTGLDGTPAVTTDPFEAMFGEPGPPVTPAYRDEAGFFDRAGDRITAAFKDALDRPVETAINLAMPGALGLLNTAVNALTGYSAGRGIAAAGRSVGDVLGFNGPSNQQANQTQTALTTAPTDPGLANDTRGGDGAGGGGTPAPAFQMAMNTLAQIANPSSQTPTPQPRSYNPFTGSLAQYGQAYPEHNFFPQMAEGGVVPMAEGGFVIPADVVSGLGDGSTKAGYRRLGLGQLLEGPGTGMSDDIPAHIDGEQPAAVADGEVYLSPKEVALVGGGRHADGVKRLYALMDRVRKERHGTTKQPKPLALGDL